MAPGDSSARLEMKYPEPEDCLVILLGPRTSPGELSLMLGVEGMAQARPERILHAPSRVTLSDCLEVCITGMM